MVYPILFTFIKLLYTNEIWKEGIVKSFIVHHVVVKACVASCCPYLIVVGAGMPGSDYSGQCTECGGVDVTVWDSLTLLFFSQ